MYLWHRADEQGVAGPGPHEQQLLIQATHACRRRCKARARHLRMCETLTARVHLIHAWYDLCHALTQHALNATARIWLVRGCALHRAGNLVKGAHAGA